MADDMVVAPSLLPRLAAATLGCGDGLTAPWTGPCSRRTRSSGKAQPAASGSTQGLPPLIPGKSTLRQGAIATAALSDASARVGRAGDLRRRALLGAGVAGRVLVGGKVGVSSDDGLNPDLSAEPFGSDRLTSDLDSGSVATLVDPVQEFAQGETQQKQYRC